MILHRGDHEVWGCSYKTGRRLFLGLRDFDGFEGEYASPIALRGSFVAVNVKESGHDTGTYATVSVYNLRNGKRLHVWSDGGIACVGLTEVTELRLAGSGSVAWVAEVEYRCGETTKRVIKADRTSRHAQELDHGTKIDPHYLELSNGTIYWRRAGVTRSAPIR